MNKFLTYGKIIFIFFALIILVVSTIGVIVSTLGSEINAQKIILMGSQLVIVFTILLGMTILILATIDIKKITYRSKRELRDYD